MRIELVNSREELLKHGRITGAGLQNTTLKKKVIDAFINISMYYLFLDMGFTRNRIRW